VPHPEFSLWRSLSSTKIHQNELLIHDEIFMRIAIQCSIFILCLTQVHILNAQQFAGDNQWVAPYGVATIVGTVGQDYSQLYLVAALIPEWEFNLQLTHYSNDPRTGSDSYTAWSFYAKHRFWQNDDETSGYAILGGLGLIPQHLDRGEVTTDFHSWWAMGVATYPFLNNTIFLDLLPGFTANFDHKQSAKTAWGFTYSSRVAIYKIIPHTAIVGEVFGTAGDAQSPLGYRAGVRWESPKWVIAGTYSSFFNGFSGAGFEIGILFFTNAIFGKKQVG
jgi:hypothetical protein